MWKQFENLNTILSFIGFIISVATLRVSYNIQKQVSHRLEKVDYQSTATKYIGQLKSIFDLLGEKPSEPSERNIENIKRITNDSVTEITARYTFLTGDLQSKLNELLATDFECITDNDNNYFDFRNKLSTTIVMLEKEKKHGI